ncbi:MAG TPA: EAL domain-containing protein [Jatrophihabitans sp.]|nr:EAL domain-containing protein [Jatrophihabitans sp.]
MQRAGRPGRRRGVPIRWYLTALVLVPLLGLFGFALEEAGQRLQSYRSAHDTRTAITAVERIADAQADVQQEIMPALAATFLRDPKEFTGISTAGLSAKSIGLSGTSLAQLRARTDAAVRRLAADPTTAAQARRAEVQLRRARTQLDGPDTLTAGFATMGSAVSVLDQAQTEWINRTQRPGVDRATLQRLSDVQLVADLARYQHLTVQDLPAAELATGPDVATLYRTLLTDWGRMLAAQAAVKSGATPAVAAAVAQASANRGALVDIDATIGEFAANRRPLPLVQVGLVYSASQTRSAAMHRVLSVATERARSAAIADSDRATRSALIIGGILLGMLLFCAAVVVAVRRAISKPMEELADEANQISQGELVPVSVRGPAEVRTAARGLAAAVENLRRIEAQAAALAAGDLDSETVRRPLPGALGAVMHRSVSAVRHAISERDAAQNDLAHRATHDALTELPNRTQAIDIVHRALHRARRTGALTGLMFIDLDHFKRVNDSLGHNAGDVVLQACAERMTAALRAGDTVFRLGGDEFVMLLEDVHLEVDAVRLAERLIEAISAPIPVEDNVATVGASIGLAFSQDGWVDAERLLNDADAAAYRAKQSGRGRVGIFDDELRATLAARAELEAALSHALKAGELLLHYQPIVALDDGRTVGVEALMRWERPGHGLVPPGDFIPVAEASALINELGRFALLEATAQLARWDAEGRTGEEFTVSVNISGRHLLSPHLVSDVRHALAASGIAPHRLTLEVTETVLVDDPVATRNLVRLRELGVCIALDDFGTGYTSIGQLPRLPIDKLKIDRSFVASADPTHRELIPLIVAAAHAFGMSVVAEGIEEPEQADSMDQLGVDTGQGFLFARPQPASAPGLLESALSRTA